MTKTLANEGDLDGVHGAEMKLAKCEEYAEKNLELAQQREHERDIAISARIAAERRVAELEGLRPAFPPLPPGGSGLPRYGLRWTGPGTPLSVPMDDGYWTPHHLAAGRVAELEGSLVRARAALYRLARQYEEEHDPADGVWSRPRWLTDNLPAAQPEQAPGMDTRALDKARADAARLKKELEVVEESRDQAFRYRMDAQRQLAEAEDCGQDGQCSRAGRKAVCIRHWIELHSQRVDERDAALARVAELEEELEVGPDCDDLDLDCSECSAEERCKGLRAKRESARKERPVDAGAAPAPDEPVKAAPDPRDEQIRDLARALRHFTDAYPDPDWRKMLHEEGCAGVTALPGERDGEACTCDGDDCAEDVDDALAIPVPPERPAKLDPARPDGLARCLEGAIGEEEAKAALWDAGIGRDQLGAALDRCREDVRGPADAGAAPVPAEPVKTAPASADPEGGDGANASTVKMLVRALEALAPYPPDVAEGVLAVLDVAREDDAKARRARIEAWSKANPGELLLRFEALDDEIPMADEEAKAILAEAGITEEDQRRGLARALGALKAEPVRDAPRCRDCQHSGRCKSLLGPSYRDEGPCDWTPSRFRAAPPDEPVKAEPDPRDEQIRDLARALRHFVDAYPDKWRHMLHEDGCSGVTADPGDRDKECWCDGDDCAEDVDEALAIPVPPERPAKLDPEKQGGLAHCLEAAISAEEAKAALWDAGIGRDQLGAALDRCREDVRGPVDAGAAPAPAEPVKAAPDPRDEAVRLGYVLCDIRSMALASTADPSRYLPGLERIYAMAHDAIHTEDAILGWPPEQRPADVRADWQTRGRALYRAMVALGDLLDDESTKTYEERYQIAVDVYVATGAWLEIDPGARPAVVGAAPEDPVPGEHRWLTPDDRAALGWAALAKDPWTTCRWCGAVRQSSGKNKPCRGRVGLTLREAHQRPRKLTREQLLDSDPQVFDLTVRVSNGLSMAGITTVREIVGMTRAQVAALRNMGEKGARDLGAVLDGIGLGYAEEAATAPDLARLAFAATEEARKLAEAGDPLCAREGCGHPLSEHRNGACWHWMRDRPLRSNGYCACPGFVAPGAGSEAAP